MRNPSLQYQNRMRRLADKISCAATTLMQNNALVEHAETKLEALRKDRDAAILTLRELEALHKDMCNITSGLYPWGLPRHVSRKEWLHATGEEADPDTVGKRTENV